MTGSVDHEPEIHLKLVRCFEACQRELDQAKEGVMVTYKEKELLQHISYRIVNADYSFLEKKPPKDFVNVEGILKYTWQSKHYEAIPSVLIYFIPFGVDWNANEFSRREAAIQERYSRYKASLGSRDIRIIMCAVRVGVGYVEKELIEERLNVIKKHAQIDNKNFVFLVANEFLPENNLIKRFHRLVREYSYTYYAGVVKRFKGLEKGLAEKHKGLTEHMLSARFNFKIAYFNEFTGNRNYMLRYYKAAYAMLVSSMDLLDEEMYEQMKVMAEYVHFKITTLHLLGGAYEEVLYQFKCHVHNFMKIYSEHPWRHYGWMADQFLIFTELLTAFNLPNLLAAPPSPTASVAAAAPVSNVSNEMDLVYFYLNAAKYTVKRETSFEKTKSNLLSSKSSDALPAASQAEVTLSTHYANNIIYKGILFLPPKYIGGSPLLLDPVMDSLMPGSEDSHKLYASYLYDQEYAVAHHELVVKYFHQALSSLSTAPAAPRKRLVIYYQLADQYMQHSRPDLALVYLWHAMPLLHAERWEAIYLQVLKHILQCAMALGRMRDYFLAAVLLYHPPSQSQALTRYAHEDLHLNIFALIQHTLGTYEPMRRDGKHPLESADKELDLSTSGYGLIRDRDAFLSSSFTPLQYRQDYGSASPKQLSLGELKVDPLQHAVDVLHNLVTVVDQHSDLNNQQSLGQNSVIHLPNRSSFFSVQVDFSKTTIELGQELFVTLTIQSHLLDRVVPDKLRVFFNDQTFAFTFSHTTSSIASSLTSKGCDLELFPKRANVFSFAVFTTEEIFGKLLTNDAVFYCEKVDFVFENGPDAADKGYNSVTFSVCALPEHIDNYKAQHLSATPALAHSKKLLSMKDIFAFNRIDHRIAHVTITKPTNLLNMSSPTAPLNLLCNILQRVDVFLTTGQYPLHNAKVYLSSDLVLDKDEPSLFWSPSFDALHASHVGGLAAFHPFALNSSQQPATPLYIPTALPARNNIVIPLFICCKQVIHGLTIKLTVECVPQDIMQSSITKEFSINVNVLKPFQEQLVFQSGFDLLNDSNNVIYGQEKSVLSLEMKYVNPCKAECAQMIAHELLPADKEAVDILSLSNDRAIVLRTNESMKTNIFFRYVGSTVADSLKLGQVIVSWRLRDHHPLLFQAKAQAKLFCCSSFPASHPLHWLLLPAININSLQAADYSQLVDVTHAVQNVAKVVVDIPDIKVMHQGITADIIAPAIVTMLEQFSIFLVLRNQQVSTEKVSLVVFLNENFLLSGSTSTTIEVVTSTLLLCSDLPILSSLCLQLGGLSEERIELRAMALRPGQLHLPQLRVTWERWGSRVVDLGDKESLRRSLFVEPCPIRRSVGV